MDWEWKWEDVTGNGVRKQNEKRKFRITFPSDFVTSFKFTFAEH